MIEVIGFEGYLRPEHDLSWGCAAIRVDDKVFNACTGFGSSPEEYAEYVEDKVVTVLDNPITMPSDWDWDGAIVLGFRFNEDGRAHRMRAPGAELFKATRASGTRDQQGWVAHVYDGRESFREDFKDFQKVLIDQIEKMIGTGLILSAHTLDLNVIRTSIKCLPSRSTDRED